MCRLRNIALESVTEKWVRRMTDKVIPMLLWRHKKAKQISTMLDSYYNYKTYSLSFLFLHLIFFQ